MKKFLAAAMFVAVMGTSSSLANAELQTWCEGFAARNGVPTTPCVCIVRAIGSNAGLSAEMMKMRTIEEYHAIGSPALKVLVDPCVPPQK